MSHEIRTPLNSVLGFLDIVLSDESIGEENTEYLVQAKKSGNILLQLITDIIDLSKIEADKIEIQESPLALQDVLVNIDSIARMLIKEKEKELTLRANVPAETDIILLGDQARIEQILINLISNAVKFTEEGYVEYGVSIGEDETVSFYVKDTGIGIPEEKKEIIFEAFRQAEEKTTKKYGGAGLGLAITSKLVERMGGSISFDSSSGKGTTFYVTLPLPEAKLEYEYVSSSSPSPAEPKETKEKNTILIVEDNAINRKVISAMLQKAGYSVLLAENGEKAVEMIKTDPSIGLILMDMYMPHMDGIEATRTIRDSNQANNGADIPIIALTAAGMESDKQQMLEAGCNAFHPKPIDKQELLSQIHEYL
jgi:CheY-like chemotaxis protein